MKTSKEKIDATWWCTSYLSAVFFFSDVCKVACALVSIKCSRSNLFVHFSLAVVFWANSWCPESRYGWCSIRRGKMILIFLAIKSCNPHPWGGYSHRIVSICVRLFSLGWYWRVIEEFSLIKYEPVAADCSAKPTTSLNVEKATVYQSARNTMCVKASNRQHQ